MLVPTSGCNALFSAPNVKLNASLTSSAIRHRRSSPEQVLLRRLLEGLEVVGRRALAAPGGLLVNKSTDASPQRQRLTAHVLRLGPEGVGRDGVLFTRGADVVAAV